jgi:hypothetical protein
MTAIGPDLSGLETAFQGEFCGGIRGFSRWKTGHGTRQYTQRKTQSGYEFEEFEMDSTHIGNRLPREEKRVKFNKNEELKDWMLTQRRKRVE